MEAVDKMVSAIKYVLNGPLKTNFGLVLGNAVALAVQPIKEDAIKKKPLTEKRRVVVTGLGVVTPLGFDADIFYNNLLDGISGISEIEAFDCAQFPTVNLC